jgi:hypothetical protein
MRTRRALFFFTCLILPAVAGAIPIPGNVIDGIALAETLKVLWDRTANDPDAHFWGLISRLTIDVARRPVTVGLRYDVDLAVTQDETSVKYRPRKFHVTFAARGVDLVLGDHYAQFGRGIVLNVLKNDEFGLDTTIQGEKLSVDTDYVSFRGLAGTINPGDPIRFVPDQAKSADPEWKDHDVVWGGEAVVSWPGKASAGARYVGAILRTDQDGAAAEVEQDDSRSLFGVSLEFPDIFGVGNFYAEYAWMGILDRKHGGVEDISSEGRALYVAMSFFGEGVDFLLEGKDYFRATFPYGEGPSLETQKVVFELPKYEDESGLRARLGYRVPVADLYVFLNYLHTKTHRIVPPDLKGHYDEGNKYDWADKIQHLYGGVEKDFPSAARIEAGGGYRKEELGRWIHAELFGSLPVLPRHSIEADVTWRQFQGTGLFEDTMYGSEYFSIGYAWSPYLSITGTYEHSNEPLAGSTGESEVGGNRDPREDFPAIEVKVKPVKDVIVDVFWGSTKGGLRCSGGICRQVPSFSGLKIEVAAQF